MDIVFLVVVNVTWAQTEAEADAQEKKRIQLPDDADKPVIVFDFEGGFRIAPPANFEKAPQLTVYADGKVECGANSPNLATVTGQLTKEELLDLLKMVVNEKGFFDITEDDIKKKIDESGQRIMIADAPSSVFHVRLKNREHKCTVYAVGMIAQQFKQIDELQRLHAIQERFRKLIGLTHLGGVAERKAVMEAVNAELKKKNDKLAPLKVEDLVYATTYSNGTLSAAFGRNEKNKEGKDVSRINVNYNRPKDAKPTISVNIAPLASAG